MVRRKQLAATYAFPETSKYGRIFELDSCTWSRKVLSSIWTMCYSPRNRVCGSSKKLIIFLRFIYWWRKIPIHYIYDCIFNVFIVKFINHYIVIVIIWIIIFLRIIYWQRKNLYIILLIILNIKNNLQHNVLTQMIFIIKINIIISIRDLRNLML